MDFTKYFADSSKTYDVEKLFSMMEDAVKVSTTFITNEPTRNAVIDLGRANINLVRVAMTAGQSYVESFKNFKL